MYVLSTMKRVLVIDAVEYPSEDLERKLGGPRSWFGRALAAVEGIEIDTAGTSDSHLIARAERAAAIILSGSPRDAWSDEPEAIDYLACVTHWMEQGKPIFGVCHGHQVMGRAAGAKVAPNPAGWELGNIAVALTAAGAASPLFSAAMPLDFLESHQDAVLEVPPGATLLAGNDHTPVQALAYGPLQFSVQFHPEYTPEILRAVWAERRTVLREELPFDIDARLDSARPTPHAPGLFSRFLDLIP